MHEVSLECAWGVAPEDRCTSPGPHSTHSLIQTLSLCSHTPGDTKGVGGLLILLLLLLIWAPRASVDREVVFIYIFYI